jgi:dUTP pyrophosphatase
MGSAAPRILVSIASVAPARGPAPCAGAIALLRTRISSLSSDARTSFICRSLSRSDTLIEPAMILSSGCICRVRSNRVPPVRPSMESEMLKIRVRRLEHGAGLPIPHLGSAGSSGFDLRACIDGDVEIASGGTALIPTGFCFEIPPGYEGQVRPRSGLALQRGVTVLNSPGTVDSDYRGEVAVILINHGGTPYRVKRGDRIAQIVFCAVSRPVLEESNDLDRTTRGKGGFGHTGA